MKVTNSRGSKVGNSRLHCVETIESSRFDYKGDFLMPFDGKLSHLCRNTNAEVLADRESLNAGQPSVGTDQVKPNRDSRELSRLDVKVQLGNLIAGFVPRGNCI